MQVEWRDRRAQDTPVAQGTATGREAKRQADEIAAGLAEPVATNAAEAAPEPLTLKTLFDIYGDEVTPTKAKGPRSTTGPR